MAVMMMTRPDGEGATHYKTGNYKNFGRMSTKVFFMSPQNENVGSTDGNVYIRA